MVPLLISLALLFSSPANAAFFGQADVLINGNAPAITNPLNVRSEAIDGQKATYSAAAKFTAATAATDIFTITGSATKTIRITKVVISGIQTTGGILDFFLIKRSAVNTGGTSAVVTAVPFDSNSPAATASVASYTVNPTALGAAIGTLKIAKIIVGAANGGPNGIPTDSTKEFIFGQGAVSALILRGATQVLSVNFNAQTAAGNAFDIFVEWTEE